MKRLLPLLAALALSMPLHAADAPYRELEWTALTPKDWDPAHDLKALNLGKLKDSDPRAMDALDRIRQIWDNAPVEPSLDGARIKLAGFVIPLERKKGKLTEFLLVPYFGACIHSPPPPANQIVLVVSKTPLKDMLSMSTVWASGTMSLQHSTSPWGAVGYRLTLDRVEPYQEPRGK